MAEKEKYYTVKEVAQRYDVSIRTVSRWIDGGLLPGSFKQNPLGLRSPYKIPQSAIDHYEAQIAASKS